MSSKTRETDTEMFDHAVAVMEELAPEKLRPEFEGYGGQFGFRCRPDQAKVGRRAARRAARNLGWKPRTTYRSDDQTMIVWDDRKVPDDIRDRMDKRWIAALDEMFGNRGCH
ncbi:hypothetical protein [Nocardia sp. NPDC051570]|uniref:hypothetical protein n=1 Tax=Nocardia sp. NPDC051570 TaxID=3364324 RepID=UPI0037919A97